MNNNYLFNVDYFEGLARGKCEYDTCNKRLLESSYIKDEDCIIEPACNDTRFVLKTLYPGIVTGLGNLHMAGYDEENDKESDERDNDAGDIKLGFSLDYVSGLPYISGSSLKGALRSVFRRYPEYINELIDYPELDKEIINLIEKSIFESGKDVFLDVYPVSPVSEKSYVGRLLGVDYITSHLADDEEMDGLRNPNPVKMMKILPGVELLFRFILEDSVVTYKNKELILRKEAKEELFKELLITFGIGAKTNTGYGRLEPVDEENEKYFWLKKSDKEICANVEKKEKSSDDVRICPNCGKNKCEKNKNTGGWFPVCRECFSKAPICPKCKNAKCGWDNKNKKWFPSCRNCVTGR